jgi:putative hydrolase of the HAD superfamily
VIRVVLFDLGGVLIELAGVATFRSWLGDRLTAGEIWRRWLTSPAVRAFETGRIAPEAFADQLIHEFGLPVDRHQFLASFAAWPRGLFPGAAELVRRVDRRYVRATLSNTNVVHWSRLLEEFGLAGLFDRHFASHLMGKLKPDPEVFEHVIADLRCAPSEILFLDDQPMNVESARHAGMHAVLANGTRQVERILIANGLLPAAGPAN